ncbi:MAG TPA: lysylphosphatidylglycerol synthase transmembrane domain-containing protein [Ignavibacteria bacterium]|nr:lysylphosphatidylglycerol synthase transmembrane domain-containing protein [Ignavibacteria bacterium]
MSINFKKYVKTIFLLALTFFFLYLAFRGNDFGKLYAELKNANYFYAISGALTGIVIGSYIRALRWRYFLNPLKKNIPMYNLFSSIMVGYMMNSIIPRAGEIYRPVLLANKEKISRTSAFGTILVERVIDVLTMLVSFGICLIYFRQKLSSAFPEYNLEAISLYAFIIIILFVIFIILLLFNLEKSEAFIEKLTKNFLPEKYHKKISELFVSLINGFLFIRYPKYYIQIFLLSALLWISYVVSTYLTTLAFNLDLSLLDANLILTMITFAVTIPLPANSAGIYHLFCTATLVSIYGISSETAFGFATVSHLLGLLGLIIIGAYFFLKENLNIKKAKELSAPETNPESGNG